MAEQTKTPEDVEAAMESIAQKAFALGQEAARAEGAPKEEFSSADWHPGRDRRQPLDVAIKAEVSRQIAEGKDRRVISKSAEIAAIYAAHGR